MTNRSIVDTTRALYLDECHSALFSLSEYASPTGSTLLLYQPLLRLVAGKLMGNRGSCVGISQFA